MHNAPHIFLHRPQLHQKMGPEVRHHTNVVQFQMGKPANLPFHMLAWGQQYVRVHNCHAFYADQTAGADSAKGRALSVVDTQRSDAASSSGASGGASGGAVSAAASTNVAGTNATEQHRNTTVATRGGVSQMYIDYFNGNTDRKLDFNRLPNKDVYEICAPGAITVPVGGPINVVYLKKFDIGKHKTHRGMTHNINNNATQSAHTVQGANTTTHHPPAIKYVYFTESDQVVRFDTFETLRALTAASNETTFFVGKRREKARDSDPLDYMGSLNIWRECGVGGYSISWPKDHVVRLD